MWRLLRAEVAYNRIGWLVSYAIAVAALAWAVAWGAAMEQVQIEQFAANSTLIYLITVAGMLSAFDKYKRGRLHSQLPIARWQAGLSVLVHALLFYVGTILLWVTPSILQPEGVTASTLWGLLSLAGSVLSFVTLMIINTHAGFFNNTLTKYIIYLIPIFVLFAVAVLHAGGQFMAVARFLGRHFHSPTGAVALNGLWLGLTGACLIVFERRASYLA